MADPLSLTLAAITLASALKDMVELAQAIEESFEKVSRNRRELRSLVTEIKTTVSQLKKFSDDHYDVLCDAVDTKLAILGLISDMRTIYDKCRDMSPPVPPNRIGRLILDVKAWLNNNNIDEDIRNLRNRVDKCHSQFMMFAVMRIESHLIVIKRQTDERPKQIQEEIFTPGPSNDNLVAFMGSNARTLSKLPPEITVDVISDAYLRIQINTIDYMLNQLSSNSYPVEDPLEVYLLPFSVGVAEIYSLDKNSRRQAMVLRSLEIQSYLCGDSQELSIQAGPWNMVDFCIGLQTLKMYQEGLTIIEWAVNIFRTLVKANSNVYMPHLVHSLAILSSVSINLGDIDGSFSAIEEAVEISRDLESSTTNIEIKFQLGEILTRWAFTWALKDEKEESLKAALEAVDIYRKTIIQHRDGTSCDLPVKRFDSPSASLFEGVPPYAIRNFGWALNQLSFSFQANHCQDEAYKTARQALGVMIFSSHIVNDNILESEIASMLFRISHQQFHDFISLEEALSLSEQGVAMFRYLYNKDVEQHAISLCDALWQQANILAKLERWEEAFLRWQETAELAKDIMADPLFRAGALFELSHSLRRLMRHDEASSIRMEYVTLYSRNKAKADEEAHGYYDLGVELRFADRCPEAIDAFQSALTRYRALAFKNPEYTKNIGQTLNQLTMNLIHCKEFDQAFNAGYESLKLHEGLLEKDSSVLAEYTLAIHLNSLVAAYADNEDKCVKRARYCVMCARNVARLHPTEGNLPFSQAVHDLGVVLVGYDQVSEAATAIQEALEWHDKHLSQEAKDVEQYMHCLIAASILALAQGYTRKVAEYLQKSIDEGKPHSSRKSVSSALVSSMYRRIQYFCVTGQYVEAVEASRQCVNFARNTEMDGAFDFICCLQFAALTFKYHGDFEEAIGYIQEALQLSCSADTLELSKNRPTILLLEGGSLAYFCEILADAGQEGEALVKGKAAVDNILGLKSKFAALPWSYIEPTYFRSLQTYSIRLAANGDLSESLDGLVQVRSHYEKRIDSRLGESLDLACVLEAEGMVCCAAGRPDDGAAAVAKLRDLQNRLRIVHPELSKNVEVALERQRASPSIIALVQKLNLKCTHEHQKSPS